MKSTTVSVDAPRGISRRRFLKNGSGVLMGTLAASSGMLAAIAPTRTWALSLSALSESEGEAGPGSGDEIFPRRHKAEGLWCRGYRVRAHERDLVWVRDP